MPTQYAALRDWVLPDIPMAPPLGMVDNAIRDSVIAFCEGSLCYRQELTQIKVLGPTSTTTTAAALVDATTITVASITDFADGDTITILLADDVTKWRGKVSGTPSGSTITLDAGLTQAVDSGAAVTKLVYLYTMTFPSGTALAKGLQAWLDDNVLEPISPDGLDDEFNNTDFGWTGVNWRTDVNLPTRWYTVDDTTVGLLLAPDATGALRINAALKPTRASTEFPTWIYQRYVETLAAGAKYRLMRVPTKPYSNEKLAAFYKAAFDVGVAEAMIRTARGATRAALRTHTLYGLR